MIIPLAIEETIVKTQLDAELEKSIDQVYKDDNE